jgi:hypothetical protein
LNRSLTGLSTQVCHLQFFQSRSTFLTGRRSVTCPFLSRCTFFFCLAALFLDRSVHLRPVTSPAARAVYFFLFSACCRSAGPVCAPFLCPVSSCACRNFFFVRSLPWRADYFFACCRSAGQQDLCAPESFFWVCMLKRATFPCPVSSRARRIFFLAVHEEAFPLFPVRSLLLCCARADFSWTFLLCPRTSHACVSGAPKFFPVQSLPAAARKFEFFFFLPSVVSGSLTTLVRTS